MSSLSAPLPRLRSIRAAAIRGGVSGILLSLLLTACAMQQTATFDSDAWKAQRGAPPLENRRPAMVSGLEPLIQVDMPRADVLALLGEPDSTRRDDKDAALSIDIYELGVSGVGVDEEFYEIRYRDDRVASRRWSRR